MINISCTALILVFITYLRTRLCIGCSGDAEMSSQAEVLKAFDDALSPRNASALVGHWASAAAWLTELQLRGVKDSVTETQLNTILKQHPVHGRHLSDSLTKGEVRVTKAVWKIKVEDNEGKLKSKTRQVFYYVCSNRKSITVPFATPRDTKFWQQVYDKRWHRTVERERETTAATTAVTRTPEPDETQNSHSSEDTAQPSSSASTDEGANKSRKVDSLESNVARNFLNIPAGNVRANLLERIELLIDVVTLRKPLEAVLTTPAEGVVETELAQKDVIHLSLKVNYILTFYCTIIEKYHSTQGNKQRKKGFGFFDCANAAVESFNKAHAGGIITSGRTLVAWHQSFRSNCRFEHPLANWKAYEPKVFQAFPLMKLQVKRDLDAMVCTETFNTDVALEYFRTTFVDRLSDELKKDGADDDDDTDTDSESDNQEETEEETEQRRKKVLAEFGMKTLSHGTTVRWLAYLGYTHGVAVRNYYCDKHESQENVRARKKFIEWFIANETRMYIWIVLTQDEVNTAKEKGDKFPKARHTFEREDGVVCHEFCVLDDVAVFLPYCHSHREQHSPFLCKLSVRKDPNVRPLITAGQDEAIMNQYVFASSSWHDSQGSAKIRPKSLGDGFMLSAFTGFVIGFGGADLPELTEEVLARINVYRTGEYIDKESAMEVHNRIEKRNLNQQTKYTCLLP